MNTKLEIHYDEETDTLSVWNGKPVFSSYEVQQHLLIELDADCAPVGFTLEHALEILHAYLPNNSTSTDTSTIGLIPSRQPDSAAKEDTQSLFTERKSRN